WEPSSASAESPSGDPSPGRPGVGGVPPPWEGSVPPQPGAVVRARSTENELTVAGALPRMSTTSVEQLGSWSTCDAVASDTGNKVADAKSWNDVPPRRYAASVSRRSVLLQPFTTALAWAVEFETVRVPAPIEHGPSPGGGGGGGGGGGSDEPPDDPVEPGEVVEPLGGVV